MLCQQCYGNIVSTFVYCIVLTSRVAIVISKGELSILPLVVYTLSSVAAYPHLFSK